MNASNPIGIQSNPNSLCNFPYTFLHTIPGIICTCPNLQLNEHLLCTPTPQKCHRTDTQNSKQYYKTTPPKTHQFALLTSEKMACNSLSLFIYLTTVYVHHSFTTHHVIIDKEKLIQSSVFLHSIQKR